MAGFARFLGVGSALALCNLGVLWLLVSKAQWPVLWACAASFVVLNFAGYTLNKFYAFQLERHVQAVELLRYYGVMGVSLGANLGAMWILVNMLRWHYLVASIVLTCALALLNYLAHRFLTFSSFDAARVTLPPPTERGMLKRADSTMRILQVSAFFPTHGGGIEAVAGQLAAHLGERGLSVHWMAGGDANEVPMQPVSPGVSIERVSSFDPIESRLGLPAPFWSPAALLALWRAVGQSDLVQIHDYLYMPTLVALIIAKLRGKRVVLTQHIGQIAFKSVAPRLLLTALNRSIGALALRMADQVIFISAPVQRYFERITRFARPPLLIPNGVDHKRYRPAEWANPQRQASQATLLFVGRFVEKKGLLLLRHCLALPAARWTFIGWGPIAPLTLDPRAPAQPAALQHRTDRVEVLGRMPAADIVPHYQQADLLVLPSTGEGFPLVVQEALACGTPVLVSTEVYEAFPDADARCVFDVELRGLTPAQAAAALRLRLEQLVSQPAVLRNARQHAHALAQQWSWTTCVMRYQDVYVALAGRSAGAAP